MTVLKNEIEIHASAAQIWAVLADLATLQQYDPTVQRSELLSAQPGGIDASRKVYMKDGKNWFEEKVTEWQPGQALAFQLTACSFPIEGLTHSYSFSQQGNNTIVHEVMEYKVKFGWLGRLMDRLMIKRQSDKGIKLFMNGLKAHIESR